MNSPVTTPEELSKAIIEVVDSGVKIINLSLGLSSPSLVVYDSLQQAYDYALRKQVIIVVELATKEILVIFRSLIIVG